MELVIKRADEIVGTLVGAAIALGIQYNSTLPGVSTSVYIVRYLLPGREGCR